MKIHILILALMSLPCAIFAKDTREFTTNADPLGMVIEVTHHPDLRCDDRGINTNGCVVAQAAGPYNSKYPRWVAPFGTSVFKVSLRDERGALVKPTERGKQLGNAPLKLVKPIPQNQPVLLFGGTNQPLELTHFDIDDMFVIQHDGRYELEMTPQLYWFKEPLQAALYLTNLAPIKLALPLKANVSTP